MIACLILDSRQNTKHEGMVFRGMIACLILDSRQNRRRGLSALGVMIACLIRIQSSMHSSKSCGVLGIALLLARFVEERARGGEGEGDGLLAGASRILTMYRQVFQRPLHTARPKAGNCLTG